MSSSNDLAPLPPAMQEIADDFAAVSARERLQLLLELSDELPDLPQRYAGHAELMEQVEECQSPLFLAVEVDVEVDPRRPPGSDPEQSGAGEGVVHLFFRAPPESPTTRGFAGILREGLDGLAVRDVLAVPDDAPYRFGLGEAVSPLRLRGMVAMLSRIKRQVRLKAGVPD